jgi:AcrR family transcriptional regulator
VRWSTSERALGPAAEPAPAPAVGLPPELERLPRGRHGLPESVVARSQRTRIVYATATVMLEKGYAATTVADIVTTAGVAKEAFYRHFRDKEEAFLEAQQYGTHFVLDALVAAHFSVEGWPQRVWKSLGAMLELVAANPLLAHLRLVESYGAGGKAVRRADDLTRYFGMFLEEGYHQTDAGRELPRLCSQAISGAVLELVQRDVAAGEVAGLARRRPQLAYVALAPFLGPAQAIVAIEEMAAAEPS